MGTRGYCPQHPVLDEELTVRQHLRLFQVAYRLPGPGRALQLIDVLSAAGYLDAPVKVLSGGTLQKLNLVLALMHDPDVVLLDEPYQGFDWETYLRFWDLAQELKDRGRTVVIVSHLALTPNAWTSCTICATASSSPHPRRAPHECLPGRLPLRPAGHGEEPAGRRAPDRLHPAVDHRGENPHHAEDVSLPGCRATGTWLRAGGDVKDSR
ncbi:hypothetical protein SGRIM128S_04018 [Streptomyces griseomycini]